MERVNSAIRIDDLLAKLRSDPLFGPLSDDALRAVANTVLTERTAQFNYTLGEVDLFGGLATEHLTGIQDIAEQLVAQKGETIFHEGEAGDSFLVILRGAVRLSKKSAEGQQTLAVLRSGQAFGEMSLLNGTPRSASAVAEEQTYLLSISADAFNGLLGDDSLPVRIMKNLSKALWATSVRLTAKQAQVMDQRAALAEFNRVLGSKLVPTDPPTVDGYQVAGVSARHRSSKEGSAWDWLTLADGRQAIALFSAEPGVVLPALDVALLRALVREIGSHMGLTLPALLERANHAYVDSLIQGVSGRVSLTLMAFDGASVEWVSAGTPLGVIVRQNGEAVVFGSGGAALGSPGSRYTGGEATLGLGDRVVALSAGSEAQRTAGESLPGLRGSAAEMLGGLVEAVRAKDAISLFDAVGVLLVRMKEAPVEAEVPLAPETTEPERSEPAFAAAEGTIEAAWQEEAVAEAAAQEAAAPASVDAGNGDGLVDDIPVFDLDDDEPQSDVRRAGPDLDFPGLNPIH